MSIKSFRWKKKIKRKKKKKRTDNYYTCVAAPLPQVKIAIPWLHAKASLHHGRIGEATLDQWMICVLFFEDAA